VRQNCTFDTIFGKIKMEKQEILNKLIDTHEQRVIGVLKKLEDDIIADLTKVNRRW
jgi:hypothetical protein